MARLIDQASSLDSICNFLPQISVNTTSKVLDSLQPLQATSSSSASLPRSTSSLSSMLHELSKASNLITTTSDELSSGVTSNNKPVLFKLDDLAEDVPSQLQPLPNHQYPHQPPQLQMHSSTSFKELCELLSIKKVSSGSKIAADMPSHTQLTKLKLLTPPLMPTDESKSALKPSRTSMRLFQKRNIKKEVIYIHFLLFILQFNCY